MGFSVSWMAFNGVPPSEVLALAGLRSTGVVEEFPSKPFQTAALPTGWTILFANDVMFAQPDNLRRLSRHHAVLGCMVEEHAMVSMSSYYARGEVFWEVVHDGSSQLLVSGSPPPELAAVRARASHDRGSGAEDDFNIPIDLARTVCGYQHDETRFRWGTVTFTAAQPI